MAFTFQIVLCMTTGVRAEEPSLSIGPVILQIGMSQDDAMDNLLKYYTLKPLIGSGQYTISRRELSSTGRYIFLGSASFENGELIYATKNWIVSEGISAYGFSEALHTALKTMEERGETVVSMRTKTTHEPGLKINASYLQFGKRQIMILSSEEAAGGKSVQIYESIRFAPFP